MCYHYQGRESITQYVLQVLHPHVSELCLRLLHEHTGEERYAHLFGGWVDTQASPGDVVNVILASEDWAYSPDGSCHVNITDVSGLIILHPDLLISGANMHRHKQWINVYEQTVNNWWIKFYAFRLHATVQSTNTLLGMYNYAFRLHAEAHPVHKRLCLQVLRLSVNCTCHPKTETLVSTLRTSIVSHMQLQNIAFITVSTFTHALLVRPVCCSQFGCDAGTVPDVWLTAWKLIINRCTVFRSNSVTEAWLYSLELKISTQVAVNRVYPKHWLGQLQNDLFYCIQV